VSLKRTKTPRNFTKILFTDQHKKECSIQESSLTTLDCIWLGIEDANPQIITDAGWKPYSIPDGVLLSTRMLLTRNQVKEILPVLKKFVDKGKI
jgi:hypothetical protein